MGAESSIGELIDHILSAYHAAHPRQIAAAIAAARHARAVEHRARLVAAIAEVDEELRAHMEKEEAMVFPWLRAGGVRACAAIRVMTLEHDDVLEKIHALEREVDAAAAAVASGDPALRLAISALATFVQAHITVENDELFTRALAG